MQVNKYYTLIIVCTLFLVGFLCSCQKEKLKLKDYLKYINVPSNGLVKTKEVAGFALSAKYIPIDYLVYRELEENANPSNYLIDSLRKDYKYSLNFILKIGPASDQSFDVMTGTVRTVEEFKEQAYVANFELQEYLALKINDELVLKPALVRMENLYGLADHRNINIVFSLAAADFEKIKTFDLIYDDDLFQTGKHHFVFDKKAIDKTPSLKF